MRYSVVLTVAAAEDFRQLDGSVKEPVAKQLRKLETAPLLGEHLGNRAGLDLTGYYKLYAAKKSIDLLHNHLFRLPKPVGICFSDLHRTEEDPS